MVPNLVIREADANAAMGTIEVWCSGSTADFDSVSRGSNPRTSFCHKKTLSL